MQQLLQVITFLNIVLIFTKCLPAYLATIYVPVIVHTNEQIIFQRYLYFRFECTEEAVLPTVVQKQAEGLIESGDRAAAFSHMLCKRIDSIGLASLKSRTI